jgi:hypothetical protein
LLTKSTGKLSTDCSCWSSDRQGIFGQLQSLCDTFFISSASLHREALEKKSWLAKVLP